MAPDCRPSPTESTHTEGEEGMTENTNRAQGLRDWAEGMHTLTAAAELLIRCGPPLLTGPWVQHDPDRDRYWFNADAIEEHAGYLSGGEGRLLDIAAALASDEHPVALGDAVSGVDRRHLELVLAAIAHAAGSHEHSPLVTEVDEHGTLRMVDFDRSGSLYPWPRPTKSD